MDLILKQNKTENGSKLGEIKYFFYCGSAISMIYKKESKAMARKKLGMLYDV